MTRNPDGSVTLTEVEAKDYMRLICLMNAMICIGKEAQELTEIADNLRRAIKMPKIELLTKEFEISLDYSNVM